jgi:hypothetical protein
MLELGTVCESARVSVNGSQAGTAWCHPFRMRIGAFLHTGENRFILEVTNLAANRIADMDRRGVPWKHFRDINFASIRYGAFDASTWEPVPSGLLGPVRLQPLLRIDPR